MRASKLLNPSVIMSPFSFFSSVQVSDRIASFREAERHLLEFARTRFAHHPRQDESDHDFELFDTPIKVPSVVGDASCQVHSNEKEDVNEGNNYSLHGVRVINKRLSSLAGDGSAALTVDAKKSKDQPAPLVLLHGYANGSLYFYRNLMGLSHHFGHVYALDMLGWGMSSRPKFDLITSDTISKDVVGSESSLDNKNFSNEVPIKTRQRVASAESFFVESLESWRKQHDLPKLTLAGHSMGGYLSVAYAERYPQHVERLILLSPVGVPERQPEDENRMSSLPFYIRAMAKTSRYLFNKGITPGSFLRSLPFSKSKAMVDGYILNRLPAITCPEERRHLSEYLYQNSMLPGSGEFCLNEILTAGAFAKMPLVHRIPNIQTTNDGDLEVHMIYGQNDWMSYQGGLETQRMCHKRRAELEERRNGGDDDNVSNPPPRIFVHGVKDASHLLMLDNYKEFNAALIIASGGGDALANDAPRPVEFVCDEVAATYSNHTRSRIDVVGEEGAAEFFRGPRWNRRSREQQQEDAGGSVMEEKKVEEQLA